VTLAARASLEQIIIIAGEAREEGSYRNIEARGPRGRERRRSMDAEDRKRRLGEGVKEERDEAEEKGVGCGHVDPR